MAVEMCALDFVRALNERKIARLLFRIIVGKYAYSEFMLMIENLNKLGYEPFFDYGLEGTEYNKTKWRKDWWNTTERMLYATK